VRSLGSLAGGEVILPSPSIYSVSVAPHWVDLHGHSLGATRTELGATLTPRHQERSFRTLIGRK